MVQEVYGTHPSLRDACEQSISKCAATREADIAEPMRQHGLQAEWTQRSLALYTQGAFTLAKAKNSPEVAAECLDHLHRFIEMLFTQTGTKENTMTATSLRATPATDKSAILAIIESMAKARYEKNPQAIAAPYSPDAAIFSLAPPLVHHGIDIAETQQWLDTWNGPIQIEPRDFQISIADDIAFFYGYM